MNTARPAAPNPAPPVQESRTATGALAEGTVFAGRYRVVRCVAAGGMGAVYEVMHIETERRRALKVMHPHLFQSDEMRERFKREARIAAQVESEYIVDVSDAGVDEATKTPFLVMELLQGEELGDRLKRLGYLPPAEVVTYLHQMALALDKTHAKLIVHRDLKPENVFLTVREDGSPRVKILDFGVAKLVAESATGAGATRSLGTPLYMAPEQFRTGSKLMPSADIYALGMMTYTLLVGEPYWGHEARTAGDVIAFAMTVIRGPQESAVGRAAARGVMLSPAFDGWFARVTALNPADRFPKASEAARALGEVFGVAASAGAGVLSMPTLPAAVMSAAAMPAFVTPAAGTPPAVGPVSTMTTPARPMMESGQAMPVPDGSGPVSNGSAAVGMVAEPLHPNSSGRTTAMPPVPAAMFNFGAPNVMLERASTSTGAAVGPLSARRPPSRRPLAAMAALVGMVAVAAGGWLALRGGGGDVPAGAASTGGIVPATAAPGPSGEPAATAPTPMASVTVSTEPPSLPAMPVTVATSKPSAAPVTSIATKTKPQATATAVKTKPADEWGLPSTASEKGNP